MLESLQLIHYYLQPPRIMEIYSILFRLNSIYLVANQAMRSYCLECTTVCTSQAFCSIRAYYFCGNTQGGCLKCILTTTADWPIKICPLLHSPRNNFMPCYMLESLQGTEIVIGSYQLRFCAMNFWLGHVSIFVIVYSKH